MPVGPMIWLVHPLFVCPAVEVAAVSGKGAPAQREWGSTRQRHKRPSSSTQVDMHAMAPNWSRGEARDLGHEPWRAL